jgi:hypothetical protein
VRTLLDGGFGQTDKASPSRSDTIPSRPILQACSKTWAPFACSRYSFSRSPNSARKSNRRFQGWSIETSSVKGDKVARRALSVEPMLSQGMVYAPERD